MTKAEAMRHANAMIDYLMNCDDEGLLYDLVNAIVSGDYFDDESIEAAESEAEELRGIFQKGVAEWLDT